MKLYQVFVLKKYTCSLINEGMMTINAIFGEGNGNPLQYPCLENPMDGGTWYAIVHGIAKSRT